MSEKKISRRDFLKNFFLTGAAVGLGAGCGPTKESMPSLKKSMGTLESTSNSQGDGSLFENPKGPKVFRREARNQNEAQARERDFNALLKQEYPGSNIYVDRFVSDLREGFIVNGQTGEFGRIVAEEDSSFSEEEFLKKVASLIK